MKLRAEEMEKTAERNKTGTNEVVGKILERLNQAIENSKSVARVDELTNEILNISGKTNLLVLNASIEAARAGEVGKALPWLQMKSASLPIPAVKPPIILEV